MDDFMDPRRVIRHALLLQPPYQWKGGSDSNWISPTEPPPSSFFIWKLIIGYHSYIKRRLRLAQVCRSGLELFSIFPLPTEHIFLCERMVRFYGVSTRKCVILRSLWYRGFTLAPGYMFFRLLSSLSMFKGFRTRWRWKLKLVKVFMLFYLWQNDTGHIPLDAKISVIFEDGMIRVKHCKERNRSLKPGIGTKSMHTLYQNKSIIHAVKCIETFWYI